MDSKKIGIDFEQCYNNEEVNWSSPAIPEKIKEKIDKDQKTLEVFELAEIRTLYLTACPLTSIFPNDIILNVLEWFENTDFGNLAVVNKKFKSCVYHPTRFKWWWVSFPVEENASVPDNGPTDSEDEKDKDDEDEIDKNSDDDKNKIKPSVEIIWSSKKITINRREKLELHLPLEKLSLANWSFSFEAQNNSLVYDVLRKYSKIMKYVYMDDCLCDDASKKCVTFYSEDKAGEENLEVKFPECIYIRFWNNIIPYRSINQFINIFPKIKELDLCKMNITDDKNDYLSDILNNHKQIIILRLYRINYYNGNKVLTIPKNILLLYVEGLSNTCRLDIQQCTNLKCLAFDGIDETDLSNNSILDWPVVLKNINFNGIFLLKYFKNKMKTIITSLTLGSNNIQLHKQCNFYLNRHELINELKTLIEDNSISNSNAISEEDKLLYLELCKGNPIREGLDFPTSVELAGNDQHLIKIFDDFTSKHLFS